MSLTTRGGAGPRKDEATHSRRDINAGQVAAHLVRAAAGGDGGAWDQLVDRYSGLVWAVARSLGLSTTDAADVSHATWTRLFEHLHSFSDPERVGSWLAATARKESLTLQRAGQQIARDVQNDVEVRSFDISEVGQKLVTSGYDTDLWTAFMMLAPPCQRFLRVMATDPPPSHAEVGAALNLPVDSTGFACSHCLDCLRQQLERNAHAASFVHGPSVVGAQLPGSDH